MFNSNHIVYKIAPIYAVAHKLYDDDSRVLITGGRENGKTTDLCGCAIGDVDNITLSLNENIPYNHKDKFDAVIILENFTKAKKGIVRKLRKHLSTFDNISDWKFENRDNEVFIHRIGADNGIYVEGAFEENEDGGEALKGFETLYPIRGVYFDEVQQFHSQDQIDNIIASLERQLAKYHHVCLYGNRKQNFLLEMESEYEKMGYVVIHPTCHDIWDLLPSVTKATITRYQKTNNARYRKMYLGDIFAFDYHKCYQSFNPDVHYITREKMNEIMIGRYVESVFFGCDTAAMRDSTVAYPELILDNGVRIIVECGRHDNKNNNGKAFPNSRCALMLRRHYMYVIDKYNLHYVNKCYTIDCANNSGFIADFADSLSELDAQYTYNLFVDPFTIKKDKYNNIERVNKHFDKGHIYILNEGDYIYDYNTQMKIPNPHALKTQLMILRYNDQMKLIRSIPNDDTDSFEYVVIESFYSNYASLNPNPDMFVPIDHNTERLMNPNYYYTENRRVTAREAS